MKTDPSTCWKFNIFEYTQVDLLIVFGAAQLCKEGEAKEDKVYMNLKSPEEVGLWVQLSLPPSAKSMWLSKDYTATELFLYSWRHNTPQKHICIVNTQCSPKKHHLILNN